jgi:hypothetical protein
MKHTKQSTGGTSFHGHEVRASVADLRKICGEPAYESNDGKDKTNYEWEMETESGAVFTIYDWKEYRPISETEVIEWHIGSHGGVSSQQAMKEIYSALDNLEQ